MEINPAVIKQNEIIQTNNLKEEKQIGTPRNYEPANTVANINNINNKKKDDGYLNNYFSIKVDENLFKTERIEFKNRLDEEEDEICVSAAVNEPEFFEEEKIIPYPFRDKNNKKEET